MNKFEKFETIEEYFDFFDIEYDKQLISVKRFHILKKYGEILEKGKKEKFENKQKQMNHRTRKKRKFLKAVSDHFRQLILKLV